ncbi:MAG: response regulator [candidate division KSB1 bacterium]|nr:response regulator [candidate division KSB1 bacterium]
MRNNRDVLLLEDDRVDAMTIERVFKQLGIPNCVVFCTDGVEGVEYLNENRGTLPAIVLLDINMPRMNGIEFLRFIRNDPDFRKLPVVILTTSTEEQDKIESFELGISGYMVKPVDYDKFVEMIQVIIKYWRLSEFPQED